MTRAALFDVGDTLVRRPTVGPGRRIATALGLDRQAARTITGWLFREPFASPAALATRLRSTFDVRGDVDGVVAEIWEAQQREPVEVDGATALVATAREHGARIAIVSNIWPPYEAGFRRACPRIVPLVDSWHVSYRAGVAKPDATLFREALAALAVAPRDAVMIGDSVAKDIAPALALGMRAIWVPATGEGVEESEPQLAVASGGTRSTDAATSPPGAAVAPDLHVARALLLEFLGATG